MDTQEAVMQAQAGHTPFPWPSLALFPQRLDYALGRARFTPAELGRQIHASRKVISNLRNRQHRVYGGPYLTALASVLDAPVDWLGSNSVPGEAVARLRRERVDAVEDLAAVITRLLETGVVSQSEVVALTSMMRIREREAAADRADTALPKAPVADAPRAPARPVIWPQPAVPRLMAAVSAVPIADAA